MSLVVNVYPRRPCGAYSFAIRQLLYWLPTLALPICANVFGETPRCQSQQVEFIVGGTNANGAAPMRTCAMPADGSKQALAARSAGQSATLAARISANIDDTGRRAILQQELNKTRTALMELEKRSDASSGTDSSQAQRSRYMADIVALEAEIRRVK